MNYQRNIKEASLVTKTPLLTPKDPYWYGNLPPRNIPVIPPQNAPEEVGQLTDQLLELTREGALFRGWLLVVGLLAVTGTAGSLFLMYWALSGPFPEPLAWLFIAVVPLLASIGIHSLRLDLLSPLGNPVRFNRTTGKIYVSSFDWNWNPFGRWTSSIQIYDWNNIEAEIAECTSFNGETLQTRYALVLAECKPGSNEVTARFDLETGHQTIKALEELWNYLRYYMTHGLDGLPKPLLVSAKPSVLDCLFHYVPWLAPTPLGKQTRQRMGAGEWFVAILFALLLPLWLSIGVFYFIVTRVAPQFTWPTEIDIEPEADGFVGAH